MCVRMRLMLVLVLALAAGAIGTSSGGLAADGTDPSFIATIPGLAPRPRTDGTYVVWEAGKQAYATSLRNLAIAPVTSDVAAVPDVDQGMVVWEESGHVRGKDILTGRFFDIAPAPSGLPAISGSWVLWVVPQADKQAIMARDLRSSGAPVTVVPSSSIFVSAYTFRDGRFLGLQLLPPSSSTIAPYWRLISVTLPGGGPTTVAEGGRDSLPKFDGTSGLMVMDSGPDGRGVSLRNFQTGGSRFIALDGLWPTTDGRYVFFGRAVSRASGDALARADLWGYDLATGSGFPVAADLRLHGGGGMPYTKGGALAWLTGSLDQPELHAARVTAVLPSAPLRGTVSSGGNSIFFPETGHLLNLGFKAFWEQNGGLPVFGYPLTEEFGQADPAHLSELSVFEQLRAVQFVERQRFEYHPELAGTPYQVELGRLGVDEAQRRELLGSSPFQSLQSPPSDDPACMFFSETGHTVCRDFLRYWESHGLEFGDRGISFRETLALFGYPISEQFTDASTGLITQYFERAAFEHHAENGNQHSVLLARLGARQLAAWGWLSPMP